MHTLVLAGFTLFDCLAVYVIIRMIHGAYQVACQWQADEACGLESAE